MCEQRIGPSEAIGASDVSSTELGEVDADRGVAGLFLVELGRMGGVC